MVSNMIMQHRTAKRPLQENKMMTLKFAETRRFPNHRAALIIEAQGTGHQNTNIVYHTTFTKFIAQSSERERREKRKERCDKHRTQVLVGNIVGWTTSPALFTCNNTVKRVFD